MLKRWIKKLLREVIEEFMKEQEMKNNPYGDKFKLPNASQNSD